MFGSRRLWCDETINGVLGIDDRYVAIRSHSSDFVYDHTTGERVTGIDARSIPSGDAPLHPSLTSNASRERWCKVSPDGKWAAIGPIGSRLRVYDNTTGEMKFPDDPGYGFTELAFSHDGARIAAIAGCAHAYEVGQPVRRIADARWGIAFDAAGDLIGGNVGKLARWSLDGSERARVSVRHKIDSLSISRDGRYASATTIITGGLCMDAMPDVVVADLEQGVAILRFRDQADITRRAVLSPDGRWLALQEDGRARLMSAAPRPPWSVPPVLAKWEEKGLVMANDHALLIGEDLIAEMIALPTGEAIGSKVKLDGQIVASPDGFVEITADRQRVRVRDRSLAVLREHGFETRIEEIAISRDGTQLASTDGPTIQILAL